MTKDRFLLCLFFLTLVSCNSSLLPPPLHPKEQSSYCSLLHIPDGDAVSSPQKPFLGIIMEPVNLKDSISGKCNKLVQIAGVLHESPAMKAGLKENDIILSINDKPICSENEDTLIVFKKIIERQEINSTIKLAVLRDMQRLSFTARLTERPFQRQPEASHEHLERCSDQPSMLGEAIQTEDKLSLFYEVRSELSHYSDFVHNPEWLSRGFSNPYQLKEFTYMLRHPLRSGEAAMELTEQLISISDDNEWKIGEMVERLAQLLDISNKPSECKDFTFPELIRIFEKTNKHINKALHRLTPEERSLFIEKALEPWNDDRWNTILELSLKIEIKELIEAFYPLLSCLTYKDLSLLRKDLLKRFQNKKNTILYETETSFGRVIVGGMGSNTYTEDAALILDLGGDDIYLNNAGGTRQGIPVAMVIDWEGDDHYLTEENFSQGAGVLGGGFLIDLGGDDNFHALDGGQGTGLFGVGLLFHTGGRGIFKARRFSQGVGQLGIGLLWSRDKESLYQSAGYGQALGLFRGVGMLIDEDGSDYYLLGGLMPDFRDTSHSTVSMGQGFGKGIRPVKNTKGVSGGIGILIDKRGDDVYIADYFAQGASYYYGVGILNDLSGNDRYIAGRYAQGAGIHSSVGVFIDQGGNDFYYASYGVAQGLGHDHGVGFFEDKGGNDRYSGGILSQGAATIGGIGIILDDNGKDSYTIKGDGQAYVQDELSMGIMIDLEPFDDSVSSHTDVSPVRIGVKE
ncbi:MAG: PDZ domain-containing protein [Thermodesulfobacteriota bacterium]